MGISEKISISFYCQSFIKPWERLEFPTNLKLYAQLFNIDLRQHAIDLYEVIDQMTSVNCFRWQIPFHGNGVGGITEKKGQWPLIMLSSFVAFSCLETWYF